MSERVSIVAGGLKGRAGTTADRVPVKLDGETRIRNFLPFEVEVVKPPQGLLKGVCMHPFWLDVDKSLAALDAVKAAGATVVRVDVSMDTSTWYVGRVKGFVDACVARAIRPILMIWYTTGPDPAAVPAVGTYGQVVAKHVASHGPGLGAIEVWNEPYNEYYWKGTPEDIVRITKEAKANAEAVPIIGGGISSLQYKGGEDWLRRMFRAGLGQAIDGLTIHPYWEPQRICAEVHELQKEYYASGIPLWLTEVGWPNPQFSEAEQAKNTADLLRFGSESTYIAAVCVYELHDRVDQPQTQEDGFGLLHHDGTPKPAFEVFRDAQGAVGAGP